MHYYTIKTMKLFFVLLFYNLSWAQVVELRQPPQIKACVSPSQRVAIDNRLQAAQARFKKYREQNPEKYPEFKKQIQNNNIQNGHVLFEWPLRASSDYDFNYSYFNFENYVDQNSAIDPDGDEDNREDEFIDDYNCQNRTYDEHRGQDINNFPFWWRMMDNNSVMAVAAAPGVIIDKDNGYFDKNCSCTGSPNRIYIEHYDGTVSSYWHLKNNTLTTKNELETVQAGEFLGFVGSSGCSSWPHLHFEVKDNLGARVEPFFLNNNCNTMNDESWWVNQRAYWEPVIARIMTHSAPPVIGTCYAEEVVNAKNQFNSSELVYVGIALIDGQNGDNINVEISRPKGVLHQTFSVPVNSTGSRKYPTVLTLLPSGNVGTWTVRATYRSKVYSHYFTVGCKNSETISGTMAGNHGFITGNLITSTGVHTGSSNTRVLYQAANEIIFQPVFHATAGIHFKARIKGCNYSE